LICIASIVASSGQGHRHTVAKVEVASREAAAREMEVSDHRGQLSSRPNPSSKSASTSLFISIERQEYGMFGTFGQPQQRLGVGHGPWPYCRSAGMASAQNTFTATAPRCPPRYRGNSPSAARIVAICRWFDAHPVVAYVSQPGYQRKLGP